MNFRQILTRADEWYRSAKAAHPTKLPCSRGCRDCCLGLFDVSLADGDLLREGMSRLDESTRRDIQARAAEILVRLRERFPDLGETLEGVDDDRIDSICDALGPVECPVLGREGECRLYEHRPLTCRLAGAPVVDRSGEVVSEEGCSRCTLRSCDAPPIEYRELRAAEERLLRKRYGDRAEVTLLIPQAVR